MAKQMMYFDADGLCRQTTRDPAAEMQRISELDSGDVPQGELWNVVSTEWLASWLKFAHPSKRGTVQHQPPGTIDNTSLLRRGRVRAGLKLRKHFRLVNPATWSCFVEWYGGGPAIEVAVSAGVQQGAPLEQHAVVKKEADGGVRAKLGRLSLFSASASATGAGTGKTGAASDAEADAADRGTAKGASAGSADGGTSDSATHIAAQMAPYSAGAKDAVRARPSLRGPVARETASADTAHTPSPASASSPPRDGNLTAGDKNGIELADRSGAPAAADGTAQKPQQQQRMLHSHVGI